MSGSLATSNPPTRTLSPRERGQEKSLSPLPSRPLLDLVISARVVTMDEVLGRLDSVRRVVVSREAIVTPAVRDELLRRGIALTFADSSNCRPTAVRLRAYDVGNRFRSGGARGRRWPARASVSECAAADCLIAATDQLAAEVSKPETLGVLLSPHAAAGLCLANRLSGVRAITACDAPGVAAAAAAVGANLLAADPQAGSFFQLKQMITEFGRGGVRPCPAVFRERLA